MADLAATLFALATGTLIGYCVGNLHRTARSQHRPQRTPRYPWQ
jgi:hypothetical protein